MIRKVLIPFVSLCFAAGIARGAECISVEGPRIRMADAAKGMPELQSADPEIDLGYAPQPGIRRVMRPWELNHLAREHKIVIPQSAEICFERKVRNLSPEEIEAAIRKDLPADTRLEILDWSRFPVPLGDLAFPLGALAGAKPGPVMWKGWIAVEGQRRFPVWALVRIGVPGTRVVALAEIGARTLVLPEHLREEPCEVLPLPGGSVRMDDISGRITKRRIPLGAPLSQSDVDAAPEVRRGDPIVVRARAGAAVVSFEGIAEGSGRTGQSVSVQNRATKKRIRARIAGPGLADVATGSQQ